jgi:FkbH-like protein
MPADAVQWKQQLADSGALDRLAPTASDLGRAASYQVESTRRIAAQTMTRAEYLASLGIAVRIAPPGPTDLGRLAQLLAKTNQFTLGGTRHPEPLLAAWANDPAYAVRIVSAVDRFGDYGVIGALIVALGDDIPRLDSFVLSCRAMGRGVEDAMLAAAFEAAAPKPLHCTFIATDKNKPGLAFFSRFGVSEPGVDVALTPVDWPSHVERR